MQHNIETKLGFGKIATHSKVSLIVFDSDLSFIYFNFLIVIIPHATMEPTFCSSVCGSVG